LLAGALFVIVFHVPTVHREAGLVFY